MSDIAADYKLRYKDGLYYKKDGKPFAAARHCNLQKGKLKGAGYKVAVVPVDGGVAMRIMPLDTQSDTGDTSKADRPTTKEAKGKDKPTTQKPVEGKEKSLEELRNEIKELKERKELEDELAALRGEKPTRGSAPKDRPKRKVFKRDVLDFPEVPGYKRRIFNDETGSSRIQDAIANGWEVDPEHNVKVDVDGDVNRPSQMGSAISRPVGTDKQGKAVYGVLMRKPIEDYEEDQALKQEEQDERIKQLAAAPPNAGLRMLKNQQSALASTGQETEFDKRT